MLKHLSECQHIQCHCTVLLGIRVNFMEKKNEAYELEKADDDEHGEGGEENEVFWVTG